MKTPPKVSQRINIVVCGSGNGAQTAAGCLAAEGHNVWLYFSPRYAERAATVQAAIDANGGAILLDVHAPDGSLAARRAGHVRGVSTNAAALLAQADVVVFSLTGPAMDGLARELAPFLRPTQLLLYLQGLGCVNFVQVQRAMAAAGGRPLPMLAATRTLPWACRLQAPAHVKVCGTKSSVGLVLPPGAPQLEVAMMSHLLHGLFPETTFDANPNAMEASFLPFDIYGNPVLHPGIMWGTWAGFDGQPLPERPLFYHSVSDAAVEAVLGLEGEARAVVEALSSVAGLTQPPAILDVRADLEGAYGPAIADPSTLGSLLRTNAAYKDVYHPMVRSASGAGWLPDMCSRMLSEDVPCGLVPIKGCAQILGLSTPWTDRVISWVQQQLGKQYLVGERLEGCDVGSTDAPQAYGITTAEQLIISMGRPAAAPTTVPRGSSSLAVRLSLFAHSDARTEAASMLRREGSSCAAQLQAARLPSAGSLVTPVCTF